MPIPRRHQNWASTSRKPLRSRWPSGCPGHQRSPEPRCTLTGADTGQIILAIAARDDIGAVLAKTDQEERSGPRRRARRRRSAESGHGPTIRYGDCASAGADDTRYRLDDENHRDTPTPAPRSQVGTVPSAEVAGKVSWKGRLAMRGLRAGDVRAAWVDHASPGSSFTVGGSWCRRSSAARCRCHFG